MSYGFKRIYPYRDANAANSFYEIWVTRVGGKCPVLAFARDLSEQVYWRLRDLLVKTADEGKIRNDQMYDHIDDGIYQFKAKTDRVFSFDDGRRVILTHGSKRADRLTEERKKAVQVRNEYFNWKKGQSK
jgi:hypothetical protein